MVAVSSLKTDENSWYSGGTPERSAVGDSGTESVETERRWMRNWTEPGRLLVRRNAAALIMEMCGGEVTGAGVGGSMEDGGCTGVGNIMLPEAQSTNRLWRVSQSYPKTAVAEEAKLVT